MIIDAEQYNRMCECGKKHEMTTKACIIERKCISGTKEYAEKHGLFGKAVSIYDENTYKAAGSIPGVYREIILTPEGLHADDLGVDILLPRIPDDADYLIAVGSGTVHDLTRYCAYKLDLPFVSCPTAASVDGFCSSVAAMTWHGYKKTLTATAPTLVVADLDIISAAPMRLSLSGFGDMIGKYIALADWKIAHLLTGEYFCEYIYSMTFDATRAVLESADGIKSGEISAYEKLTYGLMMSGLAMQLLGNSRCASGAEHHISHLIEMRPKGLSAVSDALHGEKVGVGTLLAAREYHKMANDGNIQFGDYAPASLEFIEKMFGEKLTEAIIAENLTDACAGITGEQIRGCWTEICKIVGEIPTSKALSSVYSNLGVKSSLSDVGVAEELADTLLEYSPLVRNRLTLMRLRRARRK